MKNHIILLNILENQGLGVPFNVSPFISDTFDRLAHGTGSSQIGWVGEKDKIAKNFLIELHRRNLYKF